MAQLDHGIKDIADAAGQQLALLAGVPCTGWSPLESTLPATIELLADRAFVARQGRQRFVVYFEFYSSWERDAPWDMLAKAGLLSRRSHLPTVCIAIVFKPRGYRPQNGTFQLEAAGGPTQQLWLREICLWQTKPEPWWEDQPGLMALYIRYVNMRSSRGSAIQYAAAAIERKVPLSGPRGEALALLTIFGEFAFPSLNVESIIGSEKMHQSKMLRRIRAEGELAASRAHLLKVVRRFFGEPFANEAEPAISALNDPARLEQLFDDVVLQGMSQEALRAALAATARRP